MKFKTDDLEDMLWGGTTALEIVARDESAGKHDCTDVDIVFRSGDQFYSFYYSQSYNEGTQLREENGDEVECTEVFPYTETVTKYRTHNATKETENE